MRMLIAFVAVALLAWTPTFAADTHGTAAAPSQAHDPHTTTTAAHAPVAKQAVLPPVGIRWPTVLMLIVIGMFVAAAVIGPIASALMPEEPPAPVAHHHDDHADHGHNAGHGGHH